MIRAAFSKIKAEEVPSVVVAYEPVWAIGTGKEAHPADAAEVIGSIRETVDALFGEGVSDELRVLYGGSVKPGNIRAFMLEEQIDGALVGASLDQTISSNLLKRRTKPSFEISEPDEFAGWPGIRGCGNGTRVLCRRLRCLYHGMYSAHNGE